MIDLLGYRPTAFPFERDRFPAELQVFTQPAVVAGAPVLLVIHDHEDHWVFLDDDDLIPAEVEEWSVTVARPFLEADAALAELATLAPCRAARRPQPGAPWVIFPWRWDDDDDY